MTRLMTRKLIRDSWKMKVRIFLLIIVVASGAALATTLQQSYQNLRSSYDTMYEENRLAHVFISLDQPRPILDNPAAQFGARGIQDIDSAIGRLSLEATIEVDEETKKALLVGVPKHQWASINDICVLASDFATQDYACSAGQKARSHVAPIGTGTGAFLHAGFAELQDIRHDEAISVTVQNNAYDLRVHGFALNSEFLLATANPELLIPEFGSLAVLWTPQETLEEIARDLGFGDPDDPSRGIANEYFLRMTSGDEADKAEDAVAQQIANPGGFADLGIRTFIAREDTATYQLAEGDVEGFQQLTPIITGIVLVISFATVSITMERLVASQRPAIGIMRALGASQGAIIRHYLAFALLVGVSGAILGIIIGIQGATAMSSWYRSIIGFPVLRLGFDVSGALLLGSISAGAAVLGGARAAVHAANVPIASAMQEQGHGRPGRFLRALSARFSLHGRLALRNLTRNRGRSSFTVAGIALSTVLTFSMIGLFDSIVTIVDEQYETRENWDGQLNVAPPQSSAELQKSLQGVGWIQEVEPFLALAGRIEEMDEPVRLVGLERDSMHAFKAVSGLDDFGRGASLLASQIIVGLYEHDTGKSLRVGDEVDLIVDGAKHRVRLDGIVEEPLGFTMYLPLETIQGYLRAPLATGAYLSITSGRTAEPDDLAQVPGFVSFAEHDRIASIMDESFEDFVQFAAIFALVGALLSVVVVLNTSAVNLQERTMEHGTLKALGLQDRSLIAVLAIENGVLGVLAAALGALLGAGATILLLWSFTEELNMTLPYNMPAAHVLAVMAVVVALTQVTTLLSARHLKRLDLASIVQRRGV